MAREVSGFQITDNSQAFLKALPKAVQRALTAIGQQAEGYAQMKAPVDTGRLRNSITNAVNMDEQAVYIGTNVDYAPYVELGTRKQKAQPFLRPAVEEHKDEYKQIAETMLKNAPEG